jgi:hypothetical protein
MASPDPIVEEVRAVRDAIAKQFDYDPNLGRSGRRARVGRVARGGARIAAAPAPR